MVFLIKITIHKRKKHGCTHHQVNHEKHFKHSCQLCVELTNKLQIVHAAALQLDHANKADLMCWSVQEV